MSVLLTCFYDILEKTMYGTCCILFILLLRYLLKRFPKVFSYCLWAVAGFRLLFSFSFQSIFSLIRIRSKRILTSDVWEIPVFQTQNLEPIPSGNTLTMTTSGGGGIESAAISTAKYAAAGSSFSFIELLSLIWLVGLLVFICYSILKYIRFNLQLKRMEFQKLSYEDQENIFEVQGLTQAFTMGIVKPCIYLPRNMEEESRQLVLLHENTHIKRKDHLFKLLGYGILCLHWFNPFVWLGFSLFCRDMEMSCDESVLRKLEGDTLNRKKDYSNVLLSMAGSSPLNRFPLFFGEPGVKQRIKNVLAYKRRTVACNASLLVVLLFFGFGLLVNHPAAEMGEKKTTNSSGTNVSVIEEHVYLDIDYDEELAKFQQNMLEFQEKLEAEVAEAEEMVRANALKDKYAAIMAQNQKWLDSIFLYPDDISDLTCCITDPLNEENQIVIYDGRVMKLDVPVPDEDLHISSITRGDSYMTITFENEETLTVDEHWEEGAPRPLLNLDLFSFASADLNLDGEKEMIFMFDLGYAGGFGGGAILIYTHTPDGWIELAPPAGYDMSNGFPTELVWDGKKMFFTEDGSSDIGLGSFTKEDLIAINDLHGFTMKFILDMFPDWNWDNIHGMIDVPFTFSFYYEEGKPVLVTKEYVSGMLGHLDQLGYLIREWRLSPDYTWTINTFFLLV